MMRTRYPPFREVSVTPRWEVQNNTRTGCMQTYRNDHLDGGVTGRPVVPVTASYGHRFLLVQVEPVQALPGVREIIPFNEDVLFFEPA